MFWFSLFCTPAGVITLLRRDFFQFLWAEKPGLFKYHLASWDSLSRPKSMGGWGIKKIYAFLINLFVPRAFGVLRSLAACGEGLFA